MTIGERLRSVRSHYGLNQCDFANKIGLKQAAIGLYENGSRNLTDRNIAIICEKYSVSETWLRTGEGEMFVETDSEQFDRFADEYGLDDVSRSAVLAFAKLPERDRRVLLDALRSIADACHDAAASDLDKADRHITEHLQNGR